MRNLYQEIIKKSDQAYNTSLVTAYITLLKTPNTKERVKQQLRMKLLLATSKIVLKAVNNFFCLTKSVPEYKLLHTHDDIVNECYITLDKCVCNLKMEEIRKFHFYLNTGLNRAMHRLYEKSYIKHFQVIDNTPENEVKTLNKGYNQHVDTSEIDLKDLTEMEWMILEFKLRGDKLSDFLRENKIPSPSYYMACESLKGKIVQTYLS